ncbi:NAD(P)H-dependent oxidoreductase [Sorangium sp. So ce448]|uniref:NAD(P)H-dependent oxidoreductase n=1 Tax=Sorangium sp. So ce448 TaxID=3133314 RepID=UPI003F641A6D
MLRSCQALPSAAGVVIATPIYKASYTGALKAFLDLLPQFGLAGKAALPLATGGTLAHVLAAAGRHPAARALFPGHVRAPPGAHAVRAHVVRGGPPARALVRSPCPDGRRRVRPPRQESPRLAPDQRRYDIERQAPLRPRCEQASSGTSRLRVLHNTCTDCVSCTTHAHAMRAPDSPSTSGRSFHVGAQRASLGIVQARTARRGGCLYELNPSRCGNERSRSVPGAPSGERRRER